MQLELRGHLLPRTSRCDPQALAGLWGKHPPASQHLSCCLPPPQHKHFRSLHSSTLGNRPRRIMRAKSRDLANVQNARRIVDLSPTPWALAWSSGKLGRFPAGHSLLFPLDALHPRFSTKQTHLQSRVKSGHLRIPLKQSCGLNTQI